MWASLAPNLQMSYAILPKALRLQFVASCAVVELRQTASATWRKCTQFIRDTHCLHEAISYYESTRLIFCCLCKLLHAN